ncbi:hypothetical protein [Thermomonas fusca]|uniref:hypothetical protein n=1 Tax=Thermomonas fusca TaxID=215690 RepID=UPI000428A0AB|nr:hypothetical protein [Thermomonas fusca]
MAFVISHAFGQLVEGFQATQRDVAASILTSPTGEASPALLRERSQWCDLMRACPMFLQEPANGR